MTLLLNCPFCGAHAQTDFIEGQSYIIECYDMECEARTGTHVSPEYAIAAWNRRAALSAQPVQQLPDDAAQDLLDRARIEIDDWADRLNRLPTNAEIDGRLVRAILSAQKVPTVAESAVASLPTGMTEIGELIDVGDALHGEKGTIFVEWNDRRHALPAGTKIFAAAPQVGTPCASDAIVHDNPDWIWLQCPHCDSGVRTVSKVAQPSAGTEDERDAAYTSIDRFLWENLDDTDYAEYSRELDLLSVQRDTASKDSARLDFVTRFGSPWHVQFEKRGNKPVRYRMINDGDSWGKWHATPREAIDAALKEGN